MVESSVVYYENFSDYTLVAASVGEPARVEFDFEKVWSFRKKTEDFDPRKLMWFHVHPSGFGTVASATDLDCAKGLKLAFGELGHFGIVGFDNSDLSDVSGEICWYELKDNQLVDSYKGRIPNYPYQDTNYFLEPYKLLKVLSMVKK